MYLSVTAMLGNDSSKQDPDAGESPFFVAGGQSSESSHPTPQHYAASPAALLQLELLLNQPVVDLAAVTTVVTNDPGLRAYVLHLAHADSPGHVAEATPSIHECIVQIGIDALRAALREFPMTNGRPKK